MGASRKIYLFRHVHQTVSIQVGTHCRGLKQGCLYASLFYCVLYSFLLSVIRYRIACVQPHVEAAHKQCGSE
eukprot:11835666-Prorocentrum_lima.AAC.1